MQRSYVAKCSWRELFDGPDALGPFIDTPESRAYSTAFQYGAGELSVLLMTGAEATETLPKELDRVCFGHTELFLRFARLDRRWQLALIKRMCNFFLKETDVSQLEIETAWEPNSHKSRVIRIEKKSGGERFDLHFSLT